VYASTQPVAINKTTFVTNLPLSLERRLVLFRLRRRSNATSFLSWKMSQAQRLTTRMRHGSQLKTRIAHYKAV
jgi:hypothetical protein